MSRAIKRPPRRRSGSAPQAFRRLNRAVDHSERNKRFIIGTVALLTVAAAIVSLALSLSPLFTH